jgi:fatty acid desaturase
MTKTRSKTVRQRRPYFYGFGKGDTIHAYTSEEWGLGGSAATSASNSTHSLAILVLVEAVITVPALLAPIWLVIGAIHLNIGVVLLCLVCTLLFTGGWFFVLTSIRGEFRARKLRRARGLPKPWYAVTDDQARKWFEEHPGIVEITRENFPKSAYPFPGEQNTTN